jgi:hypothetical protein
MYILHRNAPHLTSEKLTKIGEVKSLKSKEALLYPSLESVHAMPSYSRYHYQVNHPDINALFRLNILHLLVHFRCLTSHQVFKIIIIFSASSLFTLIIGRRSSRFETETPLEA